MTSPNHHIPHERWTTGCIPPNLLATLLVTPPDLGLEITSNPPDVIQPGMIITYRIRPFLGVSVSWVTEITHVNVHRFFVDEQRFGPYRFWHHKHGFREIENGVEISDLVHYALPFGPIGRFANSLIVRGQLETIFNYRREILVRKFGEMPRPATVRGEAP
jgi:ligand-binding SRPBCC domain-containing protein